VQACGACWHDVLVRSGASTEGTEFPVILGHEVVGVVAAVGDEVTEFSVGDRVVTVQREYVCGACRECRSGYEAKCPKKRFLGDLGLNGGYAELVAISEPSLVRVPAGVEELSVAVAACVIGTQLNALRDVANLQIGETVLVTGAGGGIGIHAVQLARMMGARVIGVTSSAGKAAAISAAGAHEVVVYERGADFSSRVLEVTDGRGCDVILENVGSALFESSLKCAAKHSRFVLVGDIAMQPVKLHLRDLRRQSVTIMGASSTSRAQLQDVMGLVQRGLVEPLVERTLPMSAAAQAHHLIEAGAVTGRLLLVPDPA
jgi:D-arabinose 1-dehydrogenase-like Zn-dependent alcohol dehydrogenase